MFCCFSKTSTEVMPATTSEPASQQEAAHRSAALTSAELSPSVPSTSAFNESR